MNIFELGAKLLFDKSDFENGIESAKGIASSAAKFIGNAMWEATKFTASAVMDLTKSAVASYSEYEQLAGGVETLFGAQGKSVKEYAESVGKTVEEVQGEYDSLIAAQDAVMGNAAKAYQTAGLSANDYMNQVIKVSAALKQSYDSNEEAAAAADLAIIDMADNANKMGTSLESIQNAYAGFAKQNYTMLDNLSLGYGGTKEEMERLLKDAEKISGVKYNLDNLGDVYSAIHVIQTELGITGTTAEEAASTIQGSMGMLSGAWQNLLTSFGTGEGIEENLNAVVDSAITVFNNILPVAETALGSIGTFIEKIAPIIAEELPGIIDTVLPSAISAVMSIVEGIVNAAPQILSILVNMAPSLIDAVKSMIPQLVSAITAMSSSLMPVGIELIGAIAKGLLNAFPDMIDTAVDSIMELAAIFVEVLPEALPQIVEAFVQIIEALTEPDVLTALIDVAIQLMIALTEGLVEAIPILIEALPTIFSNIATAVVENAPLILDAILLCLTMIGDMFGSLYDTYIAPALSSVGTSISNKFSEIVKAAVAFLEDIPNWFESLPEKLVYALGLVIGAITKWIADMYLAVCDIAPVVIDSIVNFFAELPDNIWVWLVSTVTKIGDWFTDMKTKVSEEFPIFMDNLINFFKELPGKLIEIGGQIVDGLWQGIQDGWDGFITNVVGLVDSFIQGIKDSLGIASPSKVFKQLGAWTAEGFGIGWDKEFADIKNGIISDMDFSAYTANIPALDSGDMESGYGSFNQTININQQIATADELAREIRLESRYGLMRGVAIG